MYILLTAKHHHWLGEMNKRANVVLGRHRDKLCSLDNDRGNR